MSKYQEIYQELANKIKNGEIEANSYLPSENDLMNEYQVSRDTIRRALNVLAQHGYIKKNKGKGSLVLDLHRIPFSVSSITSFKELGKTMHGKIETSVKVFYEGKVSDEIKKHLYMEEGNVYHVERVRSIDGERVILDIDYLNAQIVKGLTYEHAKNSLYEYIEKELGLKISFAKKEILVMEATKEEMEMLDMLNYNFLICVISYTYLEDATLFEYTISKHRPDKFRFVEIARRVEL